LNAAVSCEVLPELVGLELALPDLGAGTRAEAAMEGCTVTDETDETDMVNSMIYVYAPFWRYRNSELNTLSQG